MQTSVMFKNLDPSEHLVQYVTNKLDRFDKFLDNPAEANVVLSIEKFRHIAEINIAGDRLSIRGREETEDMYSAIDKALDKIDIQIKKNKEKYKKRRAGGKRKREMFMEETSAGGENDKMPRVFPKHIDYKPMDVEEAVLQMDLVDDHFLVFTNARSQRVNVLYRRRDGDYGLIQPEA